MKTTSNCISFVYNLVNVKNEEDNENEGHTTNSNNRINGNVTKLLVWLIWKIGGGQPVKLLKCFLVWCRIWRGTNFLEVMNLIGWILNKSDLKPLNNFAKKLYRRCLTRFWIPPRIWYWKNQWHRFNRVKELILIISWLQRFINPFTQDEKWSWLFT